MIETATILQLLWIRKSEKNKSKKPIEEGFIHEPLQHEWSRKAVEDVWFSGDAKLPALVLMETDTAASAPALPL